MKNILNIIIGIIAIVLVFKFLAYAIIPIIIVIIAVIVIGGIYARYKLKKIRKQYEEENKNGYKFSEGYKENDKDKGKGMTTEEEINKEDNFNGTIIDVDFEDIKKD